MFCLYVDHAQWPKGFHRTRRAWATLHRASIDIGKDEQFKPEFLKISLNNRIPAIIDRENGISLMESGAILIYLADKTGELLPKSGEGHYRALEWLMWQMGGPDPMFGQVHHFVKYNKGKAPYAAIATVTASRSAVSLS